MHDLSISPFRQATDSRYDLFVGTVGYESRASHAITTYMPIVDRVVAAPFDRNRILNFSRNNDLFSSIGTILTGDSSYREELRVQIEEYISDTARRREILGGPFRVCVDISSMTRLRLAETIGALLIDREDAVVPIEVDWVYAPARYSKRLLETGPVIFNDAIPGFEGWGDPKTPLHAVVGLGLEGDLALGVLDDLEATDTTVFEPMGFETAYDRKILSQNKDFVSGVPHDRRFAYNVTEPYTSFLKLSGSVYDLTSLGRVVILPLGPKIFALMSLLIGAVEQERVTVWRLSVDVRGDPVDRKAAGPIVGLTATTKPGRKIAGRSY